MLDKALFLLSEAVTPRNQTSIGKMFGQWEQAGFFAYIIPFLIIFALLYGILSKIKIFGEDSKKVNAILSVAIALISVQFSFLTDFFSALFPRFGIGIAVILVAMVLMGLFFEEKHKGTMMYVGGGIFVIVLLSTFFALGWGADWNLGENLPLILMVVMFLALLWAVLKGKKKPEKKEEKKE
ncbi:Uncharacterised protein [uncultured archaeon]|nr:Uncharacterised protein [uncultured archaeon]